MSYARTKKEDIINTKKFIKDATIAVTPIEEPKVIQAIILTQRANYKVLKKLFYY